jgi:DNA processing protein
MEFAPRLDLWPVLRAVGDPALAEAGRWRAAGLPPGAVEKVLGRRWPGVPLHPGLPAWPVGLASLPRGPVALLAEGNLALLQAPAVAIIGSRVCTSYGRTQARRLAEAVVAAGGVVVSGMAAGIDAEAHFAAGGRTIGVLGQGLEAPMAVWQGKMRREVLDRGGLLVSEFPPAMTGERWTFPVRNRVIAALARVVVVVEAGESSGTRITVDHALRFGREILAVPGPLDAPASVGCLQLLAEGATVVQGSHTVLSAAGLAAGRVPRYETGDEPSPSSAP